MPSKKITVQIMNSGLLEENSLVLGDSLIKQWKIPTHHQIHLNFGSFRQSVKVIPLTKSSSVRLSSGLAKRMGILPRTPLRLIYRPHSSTIQFGPLTGVLITRDFPDTPSKPFGKITEFCKELTSACRQQGVYVYFFTPNHIGSNASQLNGWVYDEGWKQLQVPAADVFYNRLTTRKLENKPSVQHFMKEVKSRYGSHFFNEKLLDKTEVFDALGKDQSLSRYMPESHLLRNYAMLKSMCTKYSVVFLKPIKGSLGKGIIRISRLDGGSYQTLATQVGGTRKQIYPNLSKLFSSMSGKMKSTRYQVQQGIHLIEAGKRPVDFRALVQKNKTGKWNVTSIVGRIAGNHHFVSNLARGGTLSTVKDVVSRSNLPAGVRSKILVKLRTAALNIAQGLDSQLPSHFGELGVDLAVDTSGRVWVLEVNSKPSKNDDTQLEPGKIRPSVKQVVEYVRYLSGF